MHGKNISQQDFVLTLSACRHYSRVFLNWILRTIESCISHRPDSHSLHVRVWPTRLPSKVKMESEFYVCTHVHIPHIHISVSGVDRRSL